MTSFEKLMNDFFETRLRNLCLISEKETEINQTGKIEICPACEKSFLNGLL